MCVLKKYIKSQKYGTPRKIQKGKVSNQMAKSKAQIIKRMDNNCHIPDLVQVFSHEENSGLTLVLTLAKPLTCMTVASNSIILTMMCEQHP